MRLAPTPPAFAALAALLSAALLLAPPAACLAADAAADPGGRARPAHRHHPAARARTAPSDMDATLARRAEADRLLGRPDWDPPRPLASHFPPATRERVAAPPFTGWGYGAPVPGAWPGF